MLCHGLGCDYLKSSDAGGGLVLCLGHGMLELGGSFGRDARGLGAIKPELRNIVPESLAVYSHGEACLLRGERALGAPVAGLPKAGDMLA